VLPGSDASSAYLKTVKDQEAKIIQLEAALEEARKDREQLNKYQEQATNEFREKVVEHRKRAHENTFTVLENDDEIKSDPEKIKEVKRLKEEAEQADKVYAEKMLVKLDQLGKPCRVEFDSNDLLSVIAAGGQTMHAFNSVAQKLANTVINKQQQQEIAQAKAAAAAGATTTTSAAAAPVPAPQNTVAAAPPGDQANNLRVIRDKNALIEHMNKNFKNSPLNRTNPVKTEAAK
jgi:hypothetical protein